MYPKKDIDALNRRRKQAARLRFLKRRMIEVLTELPFARGQIPSLPKGLAVPPPWAINAILAATKRMLKPFAHLTPEEIKKDPMGALQEMLGLYRAMQVHINADTSAMVKENPRDRHFRDIKEIGASLTPASFLTHLRKLEQVFETKLPTPTPAQLEEYAERHRRGLTEFMNADEGLVALKHQQTEILYVVWYFWPLLDKLPLIRAEDLKKFIAAETGIHTSIKTVEVIYTEIRLADRARSKK